ncbi:hypothetical protein, partial [Motiliproteus sp. MSK22-1]|uniref:beta strand repeat-containing protein n=1 Tax=Motiliproteus sp. MSK22-1 TaxID=1897630 RepID=UPI0018E921A1
MITLTSLQDSGGTANGGDDTAALAVASTVNVVAMPTITSSVYDFNSNQMTVTGTNFVANAGATNDVDLSDLTITGEGGASYTLTTATDVEITNATTFSFTLSGTDLFNVETLLNQDGTVAAGGTTYNLAAADDFITATSIGDSADTTGNGITVSNYAVPMLTSAAYDWSTGQLVLTGTNLVPLAGASNDLDASLLTITGAGGATYTLTDTADVEISSDTGATLSLSASDQLNVQGLLHKDGNLSGDATAYNIAAAEDWITGAPASSVIADLTGNAVTVSNVATPTVTSSTYDASAGTLVVTGTNLFKKNGANNDIDVSMLTLTGEGGSTYTLTNSSDVEITSSTAFTVTLSATDQGAVNQILNKNGTSSTSATTYNLAAAEDWAAGADSAANVADTTGNGVTVSNVAAPVITSATYDFVTGTLAVTGTGFLQLSGAANDIDVSLLTLTGE